MLPHFLKKTFFLEPFYSLYFCLPDKSNMYMKMSKGHWGSVTNRGKPRYLKTFEPVKIFRHKFSMEWLESKPGFHSGRLVTNS